MKKEGAKRVEITAVDDERQITAVFAGGGGGGLIYKGTTPWCLPGVPFPQDWDVTLSHNHLCGADLGSLCQQQKKRTETHT